MLSVLYNPVLLREVIEKEFGGNRWKFIEALGNEDLSLVVDRIYKYGEFVTDDLLVMGKVERFCHKRMDYHDRKYFDLLTDKGYSKEIKDSGLIYFGKMFYFYYRMLDVLVDKEVKTLNDALAKFNYKPAIEEVKIFVDSGGLIG